MTPITDEAKHSAAHVLAQAVQRIYPKVKIGIGPVNREGFYYDFDLGDKKITTDKIDIAEIEQEIKKIILENLPFKQVTMAKNAALNYMLQKGQIYKSEIINIVPEDEISFFKTGEEFIDVCRGPHLTSTGELGPVILTKVSEVNWNDDKNRPSMIRIYGKTFYNEEELTDYKRMEEEKLKRSFTSILKNVGLANKDGQFNILGLKYIEKVTLDLNKALDIGSNLHTDILEKHANNAELIKKLSNMNFQVQRPKEKTALKVSGKTLLADQSLKDGVSDQLTYFVAVYCKEAEIFLHTGIIESFLDQINFENNNVNAEIAYKDSDNSLFAAISGVLQNRYISHDRIITETNDIVLRINVTDELNRQWRLAEVRILLNGDKSIMLFTLPLMNYIAFHLESNPNFTKTYYDIFLIPIARKFESYAFDLADELSSKGFVTKVLKNTRSLKHRIHQSYKHNVKYTMLLGAKEVQNNSVSLRTIEEDIGLVSNEELISYLEK
jgi:hypothetical protein